MRAIIVRCAIMTSGGQITGNNFAEDARHLETIQRFEERTKQKVLIIGL